MAEIRRLLELFACDGNDNLSYPSTATSARKIEMNLFSKLRVKRFLEAGTGEPEEIPTDRAKTSSSSKNDFRYYETISLE